MDGGYSPWSNYSICTVTCGGGTQIRNRPCDNPNPQNGGKNCSQIGDPEESRACNVLPCPGKCLGVIQKVRTLSCILWKISLGHSIVNTSFPT